MNHVDICLLPPRTQALLPGVLVCLGIVIQEGELKLHSTQG